jgi:hypothetical protein
MKVYVATTSSDIHKAEELANDGDIILTVASAVGERSSVGSNINAAGRLSESNERTIQRKLLETIQMLNAPYAGYVRSYANDFYSCFLREYFELSASLRAIVANGSVESIVLIGPPPLHSIPIFLASSLELPKGSATIRSAALMYWLQRQHWEVSIESYWTRNDLIGRVRTPLLTLITAGIFSKYLARSIYARLACLGIDAEGPEPSGHLLFVVRAPHQQRFAAELALELSAMCLIIPSFTQGGFRSDATMIAGLRHVAVSKISDVVASIASVTAQVALNTPVPLEPGPGNHQAIGLLPEMVTEMAREVRRFPILLSSERLLARALRRMTSPLGVITFEISGREAGLLRAAVHSVRAKVIAIQTVGIQRTPLPVFPFADVFLASSVAAKENLLDVGTEAYGRVIYGGTPYRRVGASEGEARLLVFFTQPYDFVITEKIIHCLLRIGQELKDVGLIIRLHPRDSVRNYSHPIQHAITQHRNSFELHDLFDQSPMVVARTSSVLSEAAARGLQICAVPWGELDRRLDVEYLKEGPHLCLSESDLRLRLHSWYEGTLDSAQPSDDLGPSMADSLRMLIAGRC